MLLHITSSLGHTLPDPSRSILRTAVCCTAFLTGQPISILNEETWRRWYTDWPAHTSNVRGHPTSRPLSVHDLCKVPPAVVAEMETLCCQLLRTLHSGVLCNLHWQQLHRLLVVTPVIVLVILVTTAVPSTARSSSVTSGAQSVLRQPPDSSSAVLPRCLRR